MTSRFSLLGIISELALWSIIVFIVFYVGSRFSPGGLPLQKAPRQTITLQFDDVNQLAVGSPVNFMGTDVGYVTRVKPIGDHVLVEFQTYPGATRIPKGTQFNVEFNGLAGAKTLEGLPPLPGQKMDSYITVEPVRIRDVMDTQMVLAEALEYNSKNFARSLGEVTDATVLLERLDTFQMRLVQSNRMMVFAIEALRHETERIHNAVTGTTTTIADVNAALGKIRQMTEPEFFRTNTMQTLRYITYATEDTYRAFTNAKNEYHLNQTGRRLQETNAKLIHIQQSLKETVPGVMKGIVGFNCSLAQTDAFLCRIEQSLLERPLRERIQSLQKRTQTLPELFRWLTPQQPTP